MSFEGQSLLTPELSLEGTIVSSGENIAIRVSGVSKCYHLYDKPQDRLRQSIYPRLQRMFGRTARRYAREFWALKDISFEVKKGETVGIIGRNGSGKSTLLQIIAGTLEPTQGEIKVNGRVAALLELGSGFNPEFTGRENVYINAAILGLSRAEIDARFDDIAAFADIGNFIEQPIKTYSSGMMVRLAFAVQVAIEPDVLIIDEALAVGDMRFTMKCIRRMRELVEKGTSCLFVSHDMSSIVNFCSEALWLQDGEILLSGAPKFVTMNYANFMTYGLTPKGTCLKEEQASDSSKLNLNPGSNPSESQVNRCESSQKKALQWVDLDDLPSSGEGGAKILRVALTNADGNMGSVFEGGEWLNIFIEVAARISLRSPIVCADIRDRRGSLIFGLNTFFIKSVSFSLSMGQRAVIKFNFKLPYLMNGQYGIAVAIADGAYDSHTQHHIINEALLFAVSSSDLNRRHYLVSLETTSFSVLASSNIEEQPW